MKQNINTILLIAVLGISIASLITSMQAKKYARWATNEAYDAKREAESAKRIVEHIDKELEYSLRHYSSR